LVVAGQAHKTLAEELLQQQELQILVVAVVLLQHLVL
jgi:hypothetical protein